jgi:transposase InsO family protein
VTTSGLQFLVALVAGWVNRNQQEVINYLQAENRLLRERLGPRPLRFSDADRRRLAVAAKRMGRKGLFAIETIVTPDTLLRWYRELVTQKYDGSRRRGVGRPRTAAEIEQLVVRMASENPGWGYTRIRGALYNVGHEVGRNTIKRILIANGIDPAPERGKRMSWETFLRSHWGAIAAADFFSVEVLTGRGLLRYLVLFVIDLKTRRIEIAGIVRDPNGEWMQQVARNLMDAHDGFLRYAMYLIHDRDPLFTTAFALVLRSGGVNTVRLPARSPNLNAYAERFVRSIRSECLSNIIPLGEGHLRRVVREYTEHYHVERNHQGLGNRLIDRSSRGSPQLGRIQCHARLGGLLNFYDREAA